MPSAIEACLAEWELVPDGEPSRGATATVLPVRTRAGVAAALKVGPLDPDSEHEHLALTRWDGRGAARLIRADPRHGALLLERLGESLTDSWDVEACETVGTL